VLSPTTSEALRFGGMKALRPHPSQKGSQLMVDELLLSMWYFDKGKIGNENPRLRKIDDNEDRSKSP